MDRGRLRGSDQQAKPYQTDEQAAAQRHVSDAEKKSSHGSPDGTDSSSCRRSQSRLLHMQYTGAGIDCTRTTT